MSEADIRPVARKVNAIESHVRGVASNVSGVQTQVSLLESQLRTVKTAVGDVHDAISTLGDDQHATLTEVKDLRSEVIGFLRRNELAQVKQFAQTELIEVRQTLDREYGHYAVVRRSAVGILQAMDSGLVSERAVRELSEELMITTPGYWLAPALVALGAWLRDERELGERAVTEALRRDRDKSALFFILVLQRHRREEAVARWVRHYVGHQDPLALAAEFRIVLDAATTGLFGDAPRVEVADAVARWTRQLGTRPHLAEAQVARWTSLLGTLRSVPPDFPSLRAYAPDWDRFAELSARAGAFDGLMRLLDSVFAAEIGPDQALEARVDGVLTRLTTDFDLEESPLRRTAERLAAVIAHHGDEEAAAEAVGRIPPVEQTVDFLALVSDAALGGADAVTVPAPTRRLAVALSRSWAADAVDRLEDALLQARPQGVRLVHGDWRGVLDDTTSLEALRDGVRKHYEARTVRAVSEVRLLPRAWVAGALSAVSTALGAAAFVSGHPVLGATAVVVAAVALIFLVTEHRAIPGRRERARSEGDQARAAADRDIRSAGTEAQLWLEDFDGAMAVAPALRERLGRVEP